MSLLIAVPPKLQINTHTIVKGVLHWTTTQQQLLITTVHTLIAPLIIYVNYTITTTYTSWLRLVTSPFSMHTTVVSCVQSQGGICVLHAEDLRHGGLKILGVVAWDRLLHKCRRKS